MALHPRCCRPIVSYLLTGIHLIESSISGAPQTVPLSAFLEMSSTVTEDVLWRQRCALVRGGIDILWWASDADVSSIPAEHHWDVYYTRDVL